ncbi:sigma-70 family RNA polymerase sigma factor [Opitutaceae bacterium TAV4]|uniref:RNA polymerase sigma factor n=1 Tax=Geminisphaera colitermitum TaxID=1148786 RepID=UPI0001964E7B|nr:sigma-70 family RNA polymerase sigma factor [Geminisphaera colitermitum]RRJ97263.1 sigma-70 family RNA polymerase sigma factor [Opitutaceae bacterium TAV4]RRJ98273.1 sigma-70 family RNA polymerase sigma factor [Opitutaceae bacterium TAV4]RRK02471.1 sigma-70 family RNA polymerase sigma factor [Opitutaceae bacterium TAV3]
MNDQPPPPSPSPAESSRTGEREKPGTIVGRARQNAEQMISTKAQEVALDRMLVDRFKDGDASAFDEMVSRYWDRIYAVVHQLLRNHQDAEEVTQDAFIRAHRGLVNFRGDSAFSTWLYQIATNLARNRYWYWWRRKRDKTVSFDQPVSSDNETPLSEIYAAPVESPDDITVTQEFVDRVASGMEKLNAKHREILILRNVKNLSYEEIGTILGISVGTVKSRIARARDNLRATMGGDFK